MKKITLIKYCSLLILSIVFINNTNAQLENSNWYFGLQAGLNFNDGSQAPTILTNSVMSTEGSTASVSDSSGNLLFYTNGMNIWNNNHQIMQYGSGIYGCPDSTQAVVIVPDPGNSSKYYVITNRGVEMGLSGIYYTVVDMSLNGGLGAIDDLQKNMLIIENPSANITSILNPNDNTYWLVIFAQDSETFVLNTFFSYKVDAMGISLASQTQFDFALPLSPSRENHGGHMKISPDGQTLALIHNTLDDRGDPLDGVQSIFTFDFDSTTGAVSLLNDSILLNDSHYSYGVEFSPDSNFLYVSTTYGIAARSEVGRIYQIEHKISNSSFLIYDGLDPIYGLQSAIDGKIYAVNSSGKLGVINTPNIAGAGANYVHENIDLGMSVASRELPQSVPEILLSVVTKLAKKPLLMGNPFKEEFKIKFKVIQEYSIEMFNSSGALSKSLIYSDMSNRKPYAVDTSDLPVGTYYVKIRDEQSQIWYETMLKVE